MSESTEACLGDMSEEGSCCQQEVCVLCVHMCVLVIGEFVIEWGERAVLEAGVCLCMYMYACMYVCMGGLGPDHDVCSDSWRLTWRLGEHL